MIGGWDDQGRRPHPMRPVLTAGTTWFLDGATGTPGPLGPRHRWGFGDCLSGILHDDKARLIMSDVMFGLLAETFLHPGSGQSDGAIDLKVAREAVTGYPYIPGSAVKGALRAAMCDGGGEHKGHVDAAFGQVDGAGSVLVSDARLLLLPVRSLTRAYLWLTCPLILERLRRDLERAGLKGRVMCRLSRSITARR